jgi:hypothetical protein
MSDALFQQPALWFSVPALVGTAVFALRLVLMMVAGDGGDGAIEIDADVDFDVGDGGDHLDPGSSFEILSVQAIAAFLMGFGWAGLGGLHGAGWGVTASIGSGLVGGLLMTWVLAALLRWMYSLESSGTVSIQGALGVDGEVYANVPARGQGNGQVRVVMGSRQRIYNAVSDGDEILTSSRVRVTEVNSDRTLTVHKL